MVVFNVTHIMLQGVGGIAEVVVIEISSVMGVGCFYCCVINYRDIC